MRMIPPDDFQASGTQFLTALRLRHYSQTPSPELKTMSEEVESGEPTHLDTSRIGGWSTDSGTAGQPRSVRSVAPYRRHRMYETGHPAAR